MIKSFRHKGLEEFFYKKSKRGIQPEHAQRLAAQLASLDAALSPDDMNFAAWKLHKLRGNLKDHWAVSVNGNWRLTFRFEEQDAILVDYQDYH